MSERSLVKNSIYNVFYKLLNVLFPLVSATYVARVILAKGVGEVAYAQNIVSYFSTIAALGIPNYGTREIAKFKNNLEKRNIVFSELFIINFISTIICTIAYYFMISTLEVFQNQLALFNIIGLTIIFNIFNVDWFYQGEEEFKYIATRSFVIKLLSLIAIFLFVKDQSGVIAFALISTIAVVGNNLLNIINLKKHHVKLSIKHLRFRHHMKPILYLLMSVISVEIYTMLDTTMIGMLGNAKQVAYYTNSMKLVKILISVITSIGSVLLPRMMLYHSLGKIDECSHIVSKVTSIMLILFIPSQIGIFMLAHNITLILFGSSFLPAVKTLQICSFLICGLGFSNLFGTQVLLTFSAEKKLLISTLFGAAVNVLLNLILIPSFAQNGAALASVISETTVTIISIYYAVRFINIKLDKQFIIATLISNICLIAVLSLLSIVVTSPLLNLIFSVSLGAFIYFIINMILKNPIINDFKELIDKRKAKNK